MGREKVFLHSLRCVLIRVIHATVQDDIDFSDANRMQIPSDEMKMYLMSFNSFRLFFFEETPL